MTLLALSPRGQFRVVRNHLAQLEHEWVLGHDRQQRIRIWLDRHVLQDVGDADIRQTQTIVKEEAVTSVVDEVAFPEAEDVGQGAGLEFLEGLFLGAWVVEEDGLEHDGLQVGGRVVDGADHGGVVSVVAQEVEMSGKVVLDDGGF